MEEEILEKFYRGQRLRYKNLGKGEYEFNVEDSSKILKRPLTDLSPTGLKYIPYAIVRTTALETDNNFYHWINREFPTNSGNTINTGLNTG